MEQSNQPSQNQPQLKPDSDRRFVVGWDTNADRFIVFVYDRWVSRIVYKINTIDRKLAYPYIKGFYDVNDCVAPKQRDIKFFE